MGKATSYITNLRAVAPGILRWAVSGCQAWLRDDLGSSSSLRTATAAYRSEMDTFAQFIEERCIIEATLKATAADLYRESTDLSDEAGITPLSAAKFRERLGQTGDEMLLP